MTQSQSMTGPSEMKLNCHFICCSHKTLWIILLIKANTPTFTLSFICADCPFYIVIEASGSDPTHDGEKLHNFLEEAMTSLLVTDGTVATEESKIKVRLYSLKKKKKV